MTFVVSLTALLPPPRFDGNPWTSMVVEEAGGPQGPWTQIDTQAIGDPDVDPKNPKVRAVTTPNGQLDFGWYHVIFKDAGGDASQPSEPIRFVSRDVSAPPSPDRIRAVSRLLRSKFPVPPVDPLADADLRSVTYQATGIVQAITWRIIDPSLGCPAPDGNVCEGLPDALVPTAVEAIARFSERLYVTSEPDFAEQMATGRRLRGFSAGPYSEQYFAPGEFARRGAAGRPPVDPDDTLDAVLWALMTEDARDEFMWRATGVAPPAGQAIAFDYRRQHLGYGGGSLGGVPGRSGPDGF